MSQVYDNWERLVKATLRREELRLCGQRTLSDLSLSSSSSFNFDASCSLLFGKTLKYDEILRATNYFSQSNLIEHGYFRNLFRGVLENGARVVIKRIKLASAEKELYCISELKALVKFSDFGLLPPWGHFLENRDEKYLIYKYMPVADLAAFGDLDDLGDWRTRCRFAIGLAEALSYLHHQCIPPLVHRDIQASRILPDDDFEVRLCSLGDVCTEERGSNQGPFGTFNTTCVYDVNCFGKVLLDLVTGKLGAAENDFIMNELMTSHPCFINIIDPMVWVRTVLPDMAEAMGIVMIAKACLNPEPSKRPLIAHVLTDLEHLLKVSIARDMASKTSLVGASVPKTTPKGSKFSRLVLGTWLRTKR